MQNKRIIYTSSPNGDVSVLIPAPGCGLSIEQIMEKDVPNTLTFVGEGGIPVTIETNPQIVDIADVPSDRTFRNAWFHDTTNAPQKIGIDTTKAQAVTHERRRAKRQAEFAPLDVEATIPAKATEAEAARQAIRDRYAVLQTEIDAATTPDALKAIIARDGL